MAALENILVILKSECDWDSKQERIEHLIAHESWEAVRDGLYRVLLDRGLVEHAYIIASVLWAGVLDKRPLDPNLTIAVLERQRCFRPPTHQRP